MAETNQFSLPLLAGSQAQKHVTVNEALALLDAVAQLRVESASVGTPPTEAEEGAAYLVPAGAAGVWSGEVGNLAISVNGGWRYVTPKAGWQAYNAETGVHMLFDGTGWLDATLAATPNGSATEFRIAETDHVIQAGAVSSTGFIIPQHALVFGVTGRVTAEITGALTSWRLGVPGFDDRYGSGLGLSQSSYALGLSGSPVTYFADTPLQLTGEGGDFSGGEVRLAVHHLELTPPR